MTVDPIDFILTTKFEDLPSRVIEQAELCVLDLIGTAIGGSTTPLSRIIRDHAVQMFGTGPIGILFDDRKSSPLGSALAGGITIDALDCHDGFNPVKGHIGCGVFPALLAFAQMASIRDGRDFLTAIVIGYELGARFGLSLHASTSDYHTSGAWVAVAVAALGARTLNLDRSQTRHAMGIAEYHGPRSQMMRCIDHPTMLKDGSGWGAMAGVSAACLARDGFTGAPAITLEAPEATHHWADLGTRWTILEQYFKPYPVCRWAQGPIEGVLALRSRYNLSSEQVDYIEVATFHESLRLATKEPKTTEEAQYSTSYPCAAALARGTVGLAEVSPEAFRDAELMRLSRSMVMQEDEYCNAAFPHQRYAKTTVHLKDGSSVTSEYLNPRWTAEHPPTEVELRRKFHGLADKLAGPHRAQAIEGAVSGLKSGRNPDDLIKETCRPLEPLS